MALRPQGPNLHCALTARPAWQFDAHHAAQSLNSHYGVAGFQGFGYASAADGSLCAAGAIVAYLHETQKAAIEHLQPPRQFESDRHLTIDPVSLRSLEVLRTMRAQHRGRLAGPLSGPHAHPHGFAPAAQLALLSAARPRTNPPKARCHRGPHVAREHLLSEVREALENCSDIERITARLCCRRANPRDLAALARSLDALSAAGKSIEAQQDSTELDGFLNNHEAFADLLALLPHADEIAKQIHACLPPAPPGHLRDGGVIKDGFHPDLDRLRALSRDSRTFLAEYQSKLVEKSGISTLKVGYNKVFGFYIEVTNTHAEKIPADFVRKQTVRNAERYITPELKQYEADIVTAQERSLALEQELFEQLRAQLATKVEQLHKLAQAAATLDVSCGLAHLARQRHYVRPTMTADNTLRIIDGRHPVVEQALGEQFVPTDTAFGSAELKVPSAENKTAPSALSTQHSTLHLITGPNMAGKSTYIRQVALLVLMAQAGSFLPAKEATIGIVDRIFTRVGAADDLAGGQSTFMVEMTETANILHHATDRSLVILDEIGRGTSTLDGLALAWAIAEYLAFTTKARTLFATHYHELTELAETGAGGAGGSAAASGNASAVANYNVLVREWEDQIIFMHRIAPGAADKSYGVHVARLAGVPLIGSDTRQNNS